MKCFAESHFYKSYGSKRTVISLSETKVKATTWEGDHLYPKVMYQAVNIVAHSDGGWGVGVGVGKQRMITMQDSSNTNLHST